MRRARFRSIAWAMLAASGVSSFIATGAYAAEDAGYRLGAELDPLPFFEHGFSVHAEAKPLARLRLTFGAFALRSSTSSGDNQGFTEEQSAFELSAQYCALPWSGGGLFLGAYAFFQRWEYSRRDAPGHAVAYWLTPAPAVVFQWLPWKRGLYLAPWVALGFPIRRGDHQVSEHVYNEPGIFPVFALHIGYEFELPGTRRR